MHDMRVLFDNHFIGECDAPRLRDTPNIIPTQIDQHEVLGTLLLIVEQACSQFFIFGLIGAATNSPSNWSHRNLALLRSH